MGGRMSYADVFARTFRERKMTVYEPVIKAMVPRMEARGIGVRQFARTWIPHSSDFTLLGPKFKLELELSIIGDEKKGMVTISAVLKEHVYNGTKPDPIIKRESTFRIDDLTASYVRSFTIESVMNLLEKEPGFKSGSYYPGFH